MSDTINHEALRRICAWDMSERRNGRVRRTVHAGRTWPGLVVALLDDLATARADFAAAREDAAEWEAHALAAADTISSLTRDREALPLCVSWFDADTGEKESHLMLGDVREQRRHFDAAVALRAFFLGLTFMELRKARADLARVTDRAEAAERDRDALKLLASDFGKRLVEASEERLRDAERERDHWRTVAESRPAITAEDAAAWSVPLHLQPNGATSKSATKGAAGRRIREAIRAHAAKVTR